MKKIDIPAFGEGKQIWFNIGRLRRVEDVLKTPIGDVLKNSETISLKNLLVFLSVGMLQYGSKPEQYYMDMIDKALDEGYSIADIQLPVFQALVGSGLLGASAYAQLFPESVTDELKAEAEKEKN